MCGTYCACSVWHHVWHTLCMFSVTTCLAHAQFCLPSLLLGPFLLSCFMTHFTCNSSSFWHGQQTVLNLSTLSWIELFQLYCMVSTKEMPGTLLWSLFVLDVFSTASCTMQGNCFCFVGVLFYSYYLKSEIIGYILIVSAMWLLSFINQLLHSLSCVGYYQTLHTFVLCLCMYTFLPPTCFHAFLLLGSYRTSTERCKPNKKVGRAQHLILYVVTLCFLMKDRKTEISEVKSSNSFQI